MAKQNSKPDGTPATDGVGDDSSAAPLSAPVGDTIASLQAELAAATAKIAELQGTAAKNVEQDKKIAAKMAKGLSRQQAIASIRSQDSFEASDYYEKTVIPRLNKQAAKPADVAAKQ